MPTTRIKNASDLSKPLRRMDRFTSKAMPRFRRAMEESVLILEREAKERTPVGIGTGAQGHLRGSINSEVRGSAVSLRGSVGPLALHGLPVETGTRPHFPPIDALVDWVRLKLGVAAERARGVAFLVARAISRRGTRPVRYMEDGWRAAEPRIRRRFERAMKATMKEING